MSKQLETIKKEIYTLLGGNRFDIPDSELREEMDLDGIRKKENFKKTYFRVIDLVDTVYKIGLGEGKKSKDNFWKKVWKVLISKDKRV